MSKIGVRKYSLIINTVSVLPRSDHFELIYSDIYMWTENDTQVLVRVPDNQMELGLRGFDYLCIYLIALLTDSSSIKCIIKVCYIIV